MTQNYAHSGANAENTTDSMRHNTHHWLFYGRRQTNKTLPIRTTEQRRIALRELRSRLVKSFIEPLCEDWDSGQTPPHVVSADGYKVFRFVMGETELLFAVREHHQCLHVKYVYLSGLDTEPELNEFSYYKAPKFDDCSVMKLTSRDDKCRGSERITG